MHRKHDQGSGKLLRKRQITNPLAMWGLGLGILNLVLLGIVFANMTALIAESMQEFGQPSLLIGGCMVYSIIVIALGLRGEKIGRGYTTQQQRNVPAQGHSWWGTWGFLFGIVCFGAEFLALFILALAQANLVL